MNLTEKLIDWAERGRLPDWAIRAGIRKLCRKRLADVDLGSSQLNDQHVTTLINAFNAGPIAPVPEKANEQHYEVPAELYLHTLGKRLKYSCCEFADGVTSLNEAEEAALAETCRRAEIEDGMKILELGCGWGSLTLWMAEKYPNAKITAVSNSHSQREFILNRARERGVAQNLRVITCDMNSFQCDTKVDRVVSVEMFEHMRNYRQLLSQISNWLAEDGKLFVHIFCHKSLAYEFQDQSSSDWMSRYFFSGGIMPNRSLLGRFQDDLRLVEQWDWNGTHYQKTCEAWLANMDANRDLIMPILAETYGAEDANRWFGRWRMFYLACSELFGMDHGEQWFVSHYLFENKRVDSDTKLQTTS